MKRRIFIFILILMCGAAFAQPTLKQTINSNWAFHKGDINGFPSNRSDTSHWEKVSLPHSWNTADVTVDSPSYYRGIGWYKKTIYVPQSWQGKSVYLYFEGVNQVSEVFINGQSLGKHIGGYTAFSFDIGKLLKYDKPSTPNEITVKADNSHNENIPPLNADFTFFGGIYRDVYLITANPVHFNLDDNGGSGGVKIKTPVVSDAEADVTIESAVTNTGSAKLKIFVSSVIEDAAGNQVKEASTNVNLPANGTITNVQPINGIARPHLWSPDDPYLYEVITTIKDKDGNVLDETASPLGLRWFKFDAATGFYLNGKPLKLIGANRHQDYPGMANAVPDAIHERDMQLLKDMGANFIRISHYPQDPAVLEACDRLGLLASIEIPIVNRITQSPEFTQNCENMQREMIAQNFNHPCIIIWAYMNEVLLQRRYKSKSPEQEAYFHDVATLAAKLDSLTRQEDPSRYTMISCHGDFDMYNNAGITKIPQIIGWNLYYGWYAPDFEGFGKFLDRHHRELPDKPLMVTEYGCDGDTRLHSFDPQRFDKTIEYQTIYHKHYLKAMMDRPFVTGAAMWCLVDFNSYARIDASPHKNTKGVATDERVPKDAYYYYQANLLKRPFIKIGSRNWALRGGIGDENTQCIQPVEVYSNLPEVSLWLNGKLLGRQAVMDKVAIFNTPFAEGVNNLKASAIANDIVYEDFAVINFKIQPAALNSQTMPFTEISVSLGDTRFYVDDKLQQTWLPEKPYSKGSWGYIGGHIFAMKDTNLQKFGTNQNILGTGYDPIYATQRVGLRDFKLDVPDGKYQVTLLFAELDANTKKQSSVFNLNTATQKDEALTGRSFDVFINDQKVADALGDSNYLLPLRAFSARYTIDVTGGTGIDINLKAIKGETILNGIEVKKIF